MKAEDARAALATLDGAHRRATFATDLEAARAERNGATSAGDKGGDAGSAGSLRVRGADLSRARPIRWAWERRLPLGYLALLLGAEGVGKGTVAAWLIARLTRGELGARHPLRPRSASTAARKERADPARFSTPRPRTNTHTTKGEHDG